MIITRTPFRISFAGGGTDLPDFYRLETGAVVSTAVNKYMYIMVNKRFDDTVRVSYSKTEIVDSAEELQHPIVREALRQVGIKHGIEIVSIADMPAGSGLGSSSSFTVGLLNALYAYKGQLKPAEDLAAMACHIEIDLLKEPIGKQDQYIAAYGGFKYFQFNKDGSVFTEPVMYPRVKKEALAEGLILIHTGSIRKAGNILAEVKNNIASEDKAALLRIMGRMAIELKEKLNSGCDPDVVAEYLHKGWLQKKKLATSISNDKVDEYYEKALKCGALGGKIMGAGGDGFMLFYCPKDKQAGLLKVMKDNYPTRVSLEPEGSKIIFIS